MKGDLSYFEIPVADAERGRAFYGSLFGWQFAPGNIENYYAINSAGGLDGTGKTSSPRVYFDVPDIRAAIVQVRELGGKADEPVEIPSGYFAQCRDDQGVEFRLWQPKTESQAN